MSRQQNTRTFQSETSTGSWHETIIVGGGMSGLGCAHRLNERGRDFLMITPEIGGRVRTSPDGRVNYGAYYVTQDYHWTLPLVKTGPRVRITDAWFQRAGRRYGFCSVKMIRHLPALGRFCADLMKFRQHYNRMNERADEYSRRELIYSDPVLRDYYEQSASDYIRQRRLGVLFDDYIDPLLWASFFCDPHSVSAFFLLAASLPLIVPMYTFELDVECATESFADRIVFDTVAKVDDRGPSYRVTTSDGRIFDCKNLVMATQMNVANRLLGHRRQPIRGEIHVSFYHVRGKLRRQYCDRDRNFFHSGDGAVLSRESDGSYLYFYDVDRIDKYFESYEVITHDKWKPALFFLGSELIDSNPAANLYVASDHDVPSMENAYLSGRYAASLVLRGGRKRRRTGESLAKTVGVPMAKVSPSNGVSAIS